MIARQSHKVASKNAKEPSRDEPQTTTTTTTAKTAPFKYIIASWRQRRYQVNTAANAGSHVFFMKNFDTFANDQHDSFVSTAPIALLLLLLLNDSGAHYAALDADDYLDRCAWYLCTIPTHAR